MRNWLLDVRYAFRSFAQRRGFTLISLLTLALGIGVVTSIFNLANAIFLRPLPVDEPDRLVKLYWQTSRGVYPDFSHPTYSKLRDLNAARPQPIFSDLAARRYMGFDVLGAMGEAERFDGEIVSGNYFQVLGLRPVVGRFFTSADDRQPGAHPVAVISHQLWRSRFGSDPQVVDQTIDLNGYRFSILGVAPRSFQGTLFAHVAQVWVPTMMLGQVWPGRDPLTPENSWLEPIGRLAAGVTPDRAQRDLNTLLGPVLEGSPDASWAKGLVLADPAELDPGWNRSALQLIAVCGGLVLLFLAVACVNVGGMQLARGAGRTQELSVRQALGASRGRLVRQLLTESLLLYLVGGAGAILVASWISDLLGNFLSTAASLAIDLPLDHRVLAFTLALSAVAGVVFSLAPVMSHSRINPADALHETAPGGGRHATRGRNAFVAVQFALSAVLLVVAGLLLRTLAHARAMDLGFDPEGVELVAVDLSKRSLEPEQRRNFFRTLRNHAAALPGVKEVSLAVSVPLGGGSDRRSFAVEGHEPPEGREGFSLDYNIVSANYFRTLGIALVAGRDFAASDTPGSPPVMIVNQALVDRFWPGESALGKRLAAVGGGEAQVIGVVRTSKHYRVQENPLPFVYASFSQQDPALATLHLKTAGDSGAVRRQAEAEVRRLDRTLPILRSGPLAERITSALLEQRLAAALALALGVLGLMLSTVGLTGVVAYSVMRRTREFGIRTALGAESKALIWLVLRGGLGVAALGIGVGLITALGVSGLVSSLVFGITPHDPLTFVSVPAILLGVAFLGCYLPALRAATVEPSRALRYE